MNTADLCERWKALPDEEITESLIEELLYPVQDDLWVAGACVDRLLEDVVAQRALLDLGLQRTESAISTIQAVVSHLRASSADLEATHTLLTKYFIDHISDAYLCRIRYILLTRRDRLRSFEEVKENATPPTLEVIDSVEESWDDDPWANTDVEAGPSSLSTKSTFPPLPLTVFLTEDISTITLSLASQAQITALKSLATRHQAEVFPLRFEILTRIPIFVDPSNYHDLLPAIDAESGRERVPRATSWRTGSDFVESEDVTRALSGVNSLPEPMVPGDIVMEQDVQLKPEPQSAEVLLSWYKGRAEDIVTLTGMVDMALSLVQHGVSRGIIGLDELGEDLSLMARLVYDASRRNDLPTEPITVAEWTTLAPRDIVRRYLAHSTPETLVNDFRKLVMPYLFVLETRSERARAPDSGLVKRLLYDYILNADLRNVAPIFESSKPTQLASQRLVSDDEDLARLALACLYGSNSLTDWANMSRIFECLPAWKFDTGEDDEDETDTTVASLSAFLAPTTSRPRTSPSDLLMFFKPLPARSLSRALDILDVHLESGEILSRWGVSVPLRWFLQSARDETQQRAWAMKMARQSEASTGDLDSEEIWLSLLENMLKLAHPGEVVTNSAFGALSSNEIRKIFFRGILSTGRFAIAKHLIRPRHGERLLEPNTAESICLECSREFYDNANSGNYNFGDMKLAYDCLSVAPQTHIIQKEREFIEATSRIASFNVMTRPGVPILPIEIRLTKDKLSLVSRVLSSNDSAYKHIEVLLELVRKLGFRDDALAEVKTLAMVADTALQAEDFLRAFEASERMINAVLRLRQNAPLGMDNEQVQEAVEVCWVACFQLGRQSEAQDTEKKMALLGRALELCPADKIVDILASWRRLETEEVERRQERTDQRRSRDGGNTKHFGNTRGRTSTLSSRLQNSLHMSSPALPSASALATHTLSRVAAALPFSMHGISGEERSRSRSGSPDVQSQARHALRRGVGWLIGADEDEL